MDPVEITAGRLHLRPWQPGDAAAVLAACQDPQVQRWTTVPSPYTPEHARVFVEEHSTQGWAAGTDCGFAVCDSITGELLAAVSVRRRPAHEVWDVGFWAVPTARGSGVVTDAVAAMCRWAFATLGTERIEWYAEVGNWASRRVAEKAGFAVEGVQRAGLPGRTGRVDGWCGARLASDPDRDTRRLPRLPALTDGLITLRPLRGSDAADIASGYDNSERARWLPGPVPYGVGDAEAFLADVAPEPYDGTGLPLAVTAGDDRLVGMVHLHLHLRAHKIGEIGYWTAPSARGRGLASRAARLLGNWAIDELALDRIGLLAHPDNAASQRAAEKAGFVREGVLRNCRTDPRTGGAWDMVSYSLTRPVR